MEAPAEMTCQELVELVTDYLEGKLPASRQALFEEHLAECSGCSIYLDQIRQTAMLVGRLTEEAIPQEARDALLDIFRDWKRERGLGGRATSDE
jgi:predicted anti-sigma-YlaC factor YlaD